MTQKRKAELQRKLSMAPVAKPPSGLAERIKSDIPDYLKTDRDRERLSHSVAFSLRVAASIVLLVTSVFLTMQLLSRDEARFKGTVAETAAASKDEVASPAPDGAKLAAESVPPPAVSKTRADVPLAAPVKPAASVGRAVAAAAPAPAPRNERQETREEIANVAASEGRRASDATFVGEVAASSAPAPPVPAPAPALPPADLALDQSSAAAIQVGAAAPSPERRSRTLTTKLVVPEAITVTSQAMLQRASHSPFGISTDPGAFARVKTIIERGEKPAANAVDVAALINHFAGPPDAPHREIQLQVETSRAPLATDNTAVIRYTIDSAISSRVQLTVDLNEKVIASHRFLSGAIANKLDEQLRPTQSVTGLVEVRLVPRAAEFRQIAEIELRYVSPHGKNIRLRRVVNVRDVNRNWTSASRRHRLATLGALWGESLRASRPAVEIARTANELAGEAPEDARAEELAAAATASSRPQNSGPTGSGR